MELDDSQKFLLYAVGTGFMVIIIACVMQLCIVPGSECKIPFFNPSEEKTFVYSDPPESIIEQNADYQAIIYTSEGNIKIDLFEQNAPNTVNNFIFLSSEGYYNDTSFHLLIKDFIIQGGSRNSMDNDPTNDGYGGPGYVFNDEINWDSLDLPNEQREQISALNFTSDPNVVSKPINQYSIIMANSGEGNTNGSQFIIITADNSDTRLKALEGKHTVFGKVIDGFNTIATINEAELDESDPEHPLPNSEITIDHIDILEISNGQVKLNGSQSDMTENNQNINLN